MTKKLRTDGEEIKIVTSHNVERASDELDGKQQLLEALACEPLFHPPNYPQFCDQLLGACQSKLEEGVAVARIKVSVTL